VAVGGTGVAVGGRGVAVGGRGVAVGGRGVAVGGRGVAVGGRGVAVGGAAVAVAPGAVGVAAGGVAVAGGRGVAVAGAGVGVAQPSGDEGTFRIRIVALARSVRLLAPISCSIIGVIGSYWLSTDTVTGCPRLAESTSTSTSDAVSRARDERDAATVAMQAVLFGSTEAKRAPSRAALASAFRE
jgi:hypothetical protein